MDMKDFRKNAKEAIDIVADYIESIDQRRVMADVQPGYLKSLMPNHAPEKGDKWEDIVADLEKVIMPGVTHWLSPHFHAYFPIGFSLTSIVADILCDGIACIGFSWIACPAATEMEMMMLDWLAKILKLPKEFLFSNETKGGGVIQVAASDSTFITLLSARNRIIQQVKQNNPDQDNYNIMRKLIAYCSDQAHSSAERAGLLGGIKLRKIVSDENGCMRGKELKDAIEKDRDAGNIPFYVLATLGTTSSCAFDNLLEIGPICQEEGIWLHVDAAYAGAAFVCPEYRPLLDGVEYVESFTFNPHKWLLVHFDCSTMWIRNSDYLVEAFKVDPLYLKYEKEEDIVPDFRHWQIPFGRRFRSLKLWIVLRMYGVSGLQEYIRRHVALAKEFEEMVKNDPDFEIAAPAILSVVCFRLKGPNEWSEVLLKRINDNGKICMTQAMVHGKYMIRFTVNSYEPQSHHQTYAWQEIRSTANSVLAEMKKKG